MLEVADIKVSIKGFSILRGVTLQVPDGGLVGLVGRNGAGKTTTLKSIMGLMPVGSGRVMLDAENLLAVPGHKRAGLGIGYVPEDRRLIGVLTVEDNILMPAWASGKSDGRQRLDYIYGIMPDVGALKHRRAAACSGGQQKMVALARAVMTGTKLLLLDEPFEGLSPAMGAKFGEMILALQQERLSFLIAESDNKRLDFVQRMYTIERGEIVHHAVA